MIKCKGQQPTTMANTESTSSDQQIMYDLHGYQWYKSTSDCDPEPLSGTDLCILGASTLASIAAVSVGAVVVGACCCDSLPCDPPAPIDCVIGAALVPAGAILFGYCAPDFVKGCYDYFTRK